MDSLPVFSGAIPASAAAYCGMCLASSLAPCVCVWELPGVVLQKARSTSLPISGAYGQGAWEGRVVKVDGTKRDSPYFRHGRTLPP